MGAPLTSSATARVCPTLDAQPRACPQHDRLGWRMDISQALPGGRSVSPRALLLVEPGAPRIMGATESARIGNCGRRVRPDSPGSGHFWSEGWHTRRRNFSLVANFELLANQGPYRCLVLVVVRAPDVSRAASWWLLDVVPSLATSLHVSPYPRSVGGP